MRLATATGKTFPTDAIPPMLVELLDRIRAQPARIRDQLEPLLEDVIEDVRFRGRVTSIAREALERSRLERTLLQFDLEETRKERESLRAMLRR